MAIPKDYLELVYAGFLGKNVGIRLGAPVEPAIWTYERIREVYGEVSSYLKPFRNFAADDDANGPVFFIRPLIEGDPTAPLTAEAVGRAWLDYARDGKGMFWWGGYGISTEHTAYLNLKAGIPAPESGSIARNGATVAEQIGGQIFIDTWGLVWPGNPDAAARYAATAASVSHDGDGVNGARFIAASIAAAFDAPAGGMRAVVDTALAFVPPDSLYTAVARAVIAFHDAHPGDWRACQEYLIAEWGYDRYPGLCHMIPNAGVCALALLYGDGDFSRTVEIATMCGWDTDCNAGNVGTIAGVYYGLGSIPSKYRDPINDGIVLSGLPGSLNILDIPTFSRVLAAIGYRLAGEAVPATYSTYLPSRACSPPSATGSPGKRSRRASRRPCPWATANGRCISTFPCLVRPTACAFPIRWASRQCTAPAFSKAVAALWNSATNAWPARRRASCTTRASTGAPISTTSAIARPSRRQREPARTSAYASEWRAGKARRSE